MTSERVSKRKVALPPEVREAAYPADPDFPQLPIATDPDRMLELFRAHLGPIPGRRCVIRGCVPFRFRCRQSGGRCVLQYTLQLEEPGTGRRWEQWVAGLLYTKPGEARRLHEELLGAEFREEIPEAWLSVEPVSFIPDLDMLVQVFPFDRRLPQLGAVLDGAGSALEPYLLDRLRPAGRWRVTRRAIVPTRYRTELGAALRLTLEAREMSGERVAEATCYLKVFRNRQGEDTHAFLQACADLPRSERQAFDVIRPLAYLSEWRTLAIEQADGTTLQDVLLAGQDVERAARAVGRAVAAFDQCDIAVPQTHALGDELADMKRAATLVEWACPETRDAVQRIFAAVEAGLDEGDPVLIHRDLKPDHVFLAGDRVVFIDCDSVAMGDPARDPSHLFAHIVAGVGLESLPVADRTGAATAFVDAYFASVPCGWRRNFPLHCAGALIEVAGAIFKRQEPRWREKVPAVVAQAEACLVAVGRDV